MKYTLISTEDSKIFVELHSISPAYTYKYTNTVTKDKKKLIPTSFYPYSQ